MLDFTCSVIMLRLSRSIFEGRSHEASCEWGTGAAPASEGLRNHRPRAVLGQPRRPLSSRPGPTTVKGIKAKMPRWRAERRGVHRMHLIVRSNPDTPPGAIRALRLVGAPNPPVRREGRERKSGESPRPATEQGPIFFRLNATHLHAV